MKKKIIRNNIAEHIEGNHFSKSTREIVSKTTIRYYYRSFKVFDKLILLCQLHFLGLSIVFETIVF